MKNEVRSGKIRSDPLFTLSPHAREVTTLKIFYTVFIRYQYLIHEKILPQILHRINSLNHIRQETEINNIVNTFYRCILYIFVCLCFLFNFDNIER